MADRDATEAALHALQQIRGGVFVLKDDRPDETERNRPAIDFIAVDGGRTIAIEHTQVGAFPEQEQLEAELMRHFGPMCIEVDGQLPDGASYMLAVSARQAPRIGNRDVEAMATWIVDSAPALSSPPGHYLDVPAALVPARLYRQPLLPGPQLRLAIGRIAPDLEIDRRVRITKALADKLPKLDDARQTHEATETLLVLESLDMSLSNAWDVAAAVRDCTGKLPLPDHIVLVERHNVSVLRAEVHWREPAATARPV